MPRRSPEELRSARWFQPDDLRSFGHRSRAKQMGWDRADWEGKPIVGILNTWSDLNTCHTHFKILVEQVKRGVLQAGGMPVEIPVMSVGESYTKPTSMLYRNFLAMEAEETLPEIGMAGWDGSAIESARLRRGIMPTSCNLWRTGLTKTEHQKST